MDAIVKDLQDKVATVDLPRSHRSYLVCRKGPGADPSFQACLSAHKSVQNFILPQVRARSRDWRYDCVEAFDVANVCCRRLTLVAATPQWDKVENKTTVAIYAGGSVVALWLSSTIVGAVNAVPLVCRSLFIRERARLGHEIRAEGAPA